MPTNLLRKTNSPASANSGKPVGARSKRLIAIKVGRVTLTAGLLPTETAARLWAGLPLYGVAETWGQSLHFELPMAYGRERGARLSGVLGDVYIWAEEARIIVPFGPTPISGPKEIRLPRPCNVLAHIEGDLAERIPELSHIQPGAKVTITRC